MRGSARLSSPRRGGERVALSDRVRDLLAAGEPAILVTVAEAQGSAPRDAGTAMLVTFGGSWGTIGGGHLEYHAIDVARAMLARGEDARDLDMPLGPLLGQCCGGRVRLALRRAGPAELARLARAEARARAAAPPVLIYGAGHTGRALAEALALLPLRTTVVDDRLEPVALPDGTALLRLDDPVAAVAEAPAGAAHVVLTHSHALDYRLADAALRRRDAAYVGMIGSATKRARFERAFLAGGGDPAALRALRCPIGGGAVRDKRPEVIAALVAAELLVTLGRYGSCNASDPITERAC